MVFLSQKMTNHRQPLIEFVEFLNEQRICGCVTLIPESAVDCFEKWKANKEKEELLSGNKF